MIVGDTNWLTTVQLKWDAVKICDQASIEAHHKSRLRDLLETVGKVNEH